MNPKRYDVTWFKNDKGETVKDYEELQQMFDNYRWPMVADLWLPIASAAAIGVAQHYFIIGIKPFMYKVCKEKVNE